jgi:hypothetical protein
MLGVAAATALPSEVWPFRKIFVPPVLVELPPLPPPFFYDELGGIAYYNVRTAGMDMIDLNYWGLSRSEYPGKLVWTPNKEQADAIELLSKQTRDLARARGRKTPR